MSLMIEGNKTFLQAVHKDLVEFYNQQKLELIDYTSHIVETVGIDLDLILYYMFLVVVGVVETVVVEIRVVEIGVVETVVVETVVVMVCKTVENNLVDPLKTFSLSHSSESGTVSEYMKDLFPS